MYFMPTADTHPHIARRGPMFYSLLLVVMVFAVDLALPLGVASAVPYTFAVLIALNARARNFALCVALLCCVLTIVKVVLVPDRGTTELWKVIANRCLALFSVGMTTALGLLRRRSDAQRRAAEDRTRDHLAALAHLGRLNTAGQLAAGLAHELNQPLAAICLRAEIAGRSLAANPTPQLELAESLREIEEQSRRAADVVRSLRRMVKRDGPNLERIDINATIRGVAKLIEGQAGRAGVEIRLRLHEGLTPVLGDRIQLEQVLINLLQNALDAHSPSSPSLWIEVETLPESGMGVRTVVRDNGMGLGAGDAEGIFERFYTTKPDGTGLGLAISRSIVEAHGGKLWASAGLGKGAELTFILPVREGSTDVR